MADLGQAQVRGCLRRGGMLTCLIALVVLPVPVKAAVQWEKAIDWLVLCVSGTEERLDEAATTCDDSQSASATDPIAGSIKSTLDETSLWLEELGFASPPISAGIDLASHMRSASEDLQNLQLANLWDPRCESRYCVWLVYGFPGKKFGSYHWLSESLALDPFHRSEDSEDITADVTPAQFGFRENYGLSETHELFHAVQNGYPEVLTTLGVEWIRWLIEGTAEHVSGRAAHHLGISSGSGWRRYFDQPLHSPPDTDYSEDFHRWAYGSWEFFDFLGGYLSAVDGVDYIHLILSNLLQGQKNGLLAVDQAIRFYSGRGLDEAFTEFVRERLVEPCYFASLGEWEKQDCEESGDNDYRFALSFPDTVRRLQHLAADVSANGYVVRTTVPEGETGLLTIRVPPEHDADYLHLIVDDVRLDDIPASNARNEYRTVLPAGRHEVFVRVVNVPPDLSEVSATAGLDFSTDDPAPVEFLLEREHASMTAGGGGSGTADGDPTGAVGPLAIELDDIRMRYLHPINLDQHRSVGLEKPCVVRFVMVNSDTKDAVELLMDHPGPIRPGIFQVADITTGDPQPEDHPARFLVTFSIGANNPLSGGDDQAYRSIGGTVELSPLSSQMVGGHIVVEGERYIHGEWEADGWRDYPEALRRLTVEARFRLQPRVPKASEGVLSVAECIASEVEEPPLPVAEAEAAADSDQGGGAGNEPPTPDYLPSDETGVDSGQEARGEIPALVNSLELQSTGAVDTTFTIRGSDIEVNGGCPAGAPLSLGFWKGLPHEHNYLKLGFTTADVVKSGQTGTFPLREIDWDHGIRMHPVRGGGEVAGPNRYSGSGTLTLTEHRSTTGEPRLRGSLQGTLNGADGSAQLTARFDISFACSPAP